MNPSASGWIEKLLVLLEKHGLCEMAEGDFYQELRATGFIYGTNVSTLIPIQEEIAYTEEELGKVNLLLSLLYTYHQEKKGCKLNEGVTPILLFYEQLGARKLSFLDQVLTGRKPIAKLEKVLHRRIQTNKNIFTKNFSNIITNALLFIDVLAFRQFLQGHKDVILYAQRLEQTITNVVLKALNSKEKKTDYDELLVKLVESSLRFHAISNEDSFKDYRILLRNFGNLQEAYYVLDLAAMAVWDDMVLDKRESHFIWELAKELKIAEAEVMYAIQFVIGFINGNRDKISFFNQANPVKHFYDQASKTVRVLILRNRKRLLKELKQSQELMGLLSKSTVKNLSKEEKQKVREQLVDICKTIPSLAIFALPGGAVLLPLMVKFIPQLLPSAFDENRVDKK